MGTFKLSYSAIVEQLARELTLAIVLPGDTNITLFKSRLSQAKHRSAVPGKLDFDHKYNLEAGTYDMTIVLHPAQARGIEVVSIKSTGGL